MGKKAVAPPKKHTLADTKRLKPQHFAFAKMVADGKSQYEAALTCFPAWREWKRSSVDVEASKLMSNPKIAELVDLATIGAHEIGKSYLPQAVVTTVEIMDDPAVKPDTRLKAADSIKDRFGAPRNAQVAINAQTVSLNLLADIEAGNPTPLEAQASNAASTPPPSLPSKQREQSTTPSQPQTPPPPSLPSSDLQAARDTWASIASEPSKGT